MSTSTDHLTALDSPSERRFYTRSIPSRPIYIAFGGNNLCMLLNLSENGFLISTPAGLNRNSVYRVSIRLNGVPKPIEVPVRTIWTSESHERAGIQMLDLSDHDREQIRKWQALESAREKPIEAAAAGVPLESELREPRVAAEAEKTAPPPPVAPAIPDPPRRRPPAPAVAAAAARAAGMPVAEPFKNTHLEALASSQTGPVRRRKKRSEAPAMIAWTLVGAVTFIGMALLMRPDLFGKILMHSPDLAAWVGTSVNAPEPLKELEAKNVPPSGKSTQHPVASSLDLPQQPVSTAKTSSLPAEDRAAVSTGAPAATKTHFTLASPSRPNLSATSGRLNDTDASIASPSDSAASPKDVRANTEAPNSVSSGSAPGNSAAAIPDSPVANSAPSAVTTAPITTPAPAPATSGVTVESASAGKSAIRGSIVQSAPRGNDNAASGLPAATASNASVQPTPWGASGPAAAGRSSLLRSRPDPGAVVHMDVAENRVMEITPPRGITSSFMTLPGERILEVSGMTMHIRRAVRVPADRWIWHSKKQLVLGELSSRVDPQGAHGPGYGSITVQAVIDKDGHVSELKPLNGSSAFLPSVTRAVREWQYEPTYLDGKPVETRAEIEINFHSGTNPRP